MSGDEEAEEEELKEEYETDEDEQEDACDYYEAKTRNILLTANHLRVSTRRKHNDDKQRKIVQEQKVDR